MRPTISPRRFRVLLTLLAAAEVAACGIFIASRPSINQQGWNFLERNRSTISDNGTNMTLIADGLNFAIFRRPLGGWETAYGQLFQLVNLLPVLASMAAFQILQTLSFTTSKFNSDIATVVFLAAVAVQVTVIAAILSASMRPRET